MAGSNATRLEAVEDPTLVPTCPQCERPLARVLMRRVDVTGGGGVSFGKRYVYACPECKAALGVSHRKGFWMG